MAMAQAGIFTSLLGVTFFIGAGNSVEDIYTNIWAVKVRGSQQEAKQLANKLGFQYHKHLFEEYHIFRRSEFKHASEKTPESLGIDRKLDFEPKIDWYMQQKEEHYELLFSSFNDHLFEKQWYIKRPIGSTYNLTSVWPEYTGKGVLVAVVDDGVDGNHRELSANYNATASFDFIENDEIPKPKHRTVSGHGNKCAGVIAGSAGNGLCGIGLAYNAQIAGLRIFDDNIRSTDAGRAAALSHERDEIDIYSNSWGPGDLGFQVEGPENLTQKAIELGIKQGRKGLGAIYTFATGNGGAFDNCAYSGYVNSIYTIAISGVNLNDSRPSYAEECCGIMASAYSGGVVTVGKSGCVENFGKTSAATAMASGLIALTLEAKSSLTWRDVQHIIVRSARHAPERNPLTGGLWVKNKAGLWFSRYFGFGLMDGGMMVHLAKHWNTVPSQLRCEVDGTEKNRKIPSEVSVKVERCAIKFLEHVQVSVSLVFQRRGDLYLELIAPSGTKSPLTSHRRLDNVMRRKRLTNWNITTLFNWGENPEGQWKLRIENINLKYKTTGTLYRWSLILYGTNVDPLTKNVHVPTLSTEDTAVTYSTVASPSQSTFKITTPTRESSPSECSRFQKSQETVTITGRTKRILTITLSILLPISAVMIVSLTYRVVTRRLIIIQKTKVEIKIEGSKQAEGAPCEKNLQHPILVPGDSTVV